MKIRHLTAIVLAAGIVVLQSVIDCGCLYAAPASAVPAADPASAHCHSADVPEAAEQGCCLGCRLSKASLEAVFFELQGSPQILLQTLALGGVLFAGEVHFSKSDPDLSTVGLPPNARSVSFNLPLYLSRQSLLI